MSPWIDLDDNGELIIDWEETLTQAQRYDSGDRKYDACLGKIISQIQRAAFMRGFEQGMNQSDETSRLLLMTGGNA